MVSGAKAGPVTVPGSNTFGTIATLKLGKGAWGIMATLAAVLVAGMGYWTGLWWLFVIAAALLAAGAFALYEAQKRWCALRACGIKTKI